MMLVRSSLGRRASHVVDDAASAVVARTVGYSIPLVGSAFCAYEDVMTRLRGRLKGMSIASEATVVMDSGWIRDGHFICWNGLHGASIAHAEHCPWIKQGDFKLFLCSPSLQTATLGVTLDELPEDEAAACREVSNIGSEPIKWRLVEYLHPDLSIEEQNKLSIFSIALDHGH